MISKKRALGRLPSHDYASNSCYFVTTCTFERKPFLAKIKEDKLVMTEVGEIVEAQIHWIEKQFPYVRIRTYVIMPDHIHVLGKYPKRFSILVASDRDPMLQGWDFIRGWNEMVEPKFNHNTPSRVVLRYGD